jgi:hypothetical protein
LKELKIKMNVRIKTPKDVELLCELIAQGYERRKKDYETRRLEIIYSGGGSFADHVSSRSIGNISDQTERKAERLEELERGLDGKFLKAVEQSLMKIGTDVRRDLRERLRKAVLLNCENGREYPYEVLNIDEFSRRDFYRRRKAFVRGIGVELGLVGERGNKNKGGS